MSESVKARIPRVARLPKAGAVEKREPSDAEVAVLRLISEQNAVTIDQLARFFGIYLADVVRFVDEMREQGWLEVKQLVKGEPPWVWLRGAGSRHAGLGFSPLKPAISTVWHWRAITEARLYLLRHAPEGEWVCERAVRKSLGRGKKVKRRRKGNAKPPTVHIPDGVFKVDGEVHAIEAELSRKTAKKLEAVVAQHSSRYDAVVYFCAPSTYRDIKRTGLEQRYPRLFTCCLVDDLRPLAKDEFRVGEDRRRGRIVDREVEPWEVMVLNLLAEQGAIPIDLLARFLKCEEAKADAIASHLAEAGFVMRAEPEANQPEWIWPGQRGMKHVTVDVLAPQVWIGGLPRLRALSEVRLLLIERTDGAIEWTSGRELRHRHGQEGTLPDAVAVEESVRAGKRQRRAYAIDVSLHLANRKETLLERYEARAAEYDSVLWYCAPRPRLAALSMKREFGCPKLEVRTIPGFRPPLDKRRRRKMGAELEKPSSFGPVELGDVEEEAFKVVALAAGPRPEPIRIKSVERREKVVAKEYRIGTDDGRWSVRLSGHGWKAEELLG